MGSDLSQIPWPKYHQWTTETFVPGCLTVGAYIGAGSLLRYWNVKMTWIHYLIAFVAAFAVGHLPLIGLTLVNWWVRVAWWVRIGNVITWKSVPRIVANQRNDYEMLVKRIFTGPMSFGTYWTMGGWPSYLLQNKASGMLWVVIGRASLTDEEYGIDFLEAD